MELWLFSYKEACQEIMPNPELACLSPLLAQVMSQASLAIGNTMALHHIKLSVLESFSTKHFVNLLIE